MDNSPLFNHLILENILGYLDLPELQSFRLVCSYWNEISKPFVVQKGALSLEGSRLDQFLEFASSAQNDPVNFLPFESCTIKIGSVLSENSSLMRKAWMILQYPIKFLTLYITTLYAQRELKWLLLNNLCNAAKIKLIVTKYWGDDIQESDINSEDAEIILNRNLRSFQFCYLGFDDDVMNNEFIFPVKWGAFFARFPELNFLGLVGLNSHDVTKMIEALEEIQGGCQLQCLEIFDERTFPVAPTDDHLMRIGQLNCHFKAMHFELSPVTSPSVLNTVLERKVNSLESLRLCRFPYPFLLITPILLSDVTLRSLTFLEVSDALLPSLSFLSCLPALKTFHIILRDYRNIPYCEIAQNTSIPFCHSGLTNLYIEAPLISKDCIEKLAISFPNLQTLRLRVNNELLEAVFVQELWKNLRTLYITSWGGLTDEGITGISQKTLDLWGGYSHFGPMKQRTKPYIGCLSDLNSLTIEMWSDYENHISDWSVYYGMLDLRELREITLIRSGISTTAFQAIPLRNKKMIF